MATNLFLRLDVGAFGVNLPNTAKGTWAATTTNGFTTNAKAMGTTAGSVQTSLASGTSTLGNVAVAQFCSLPISGTTVLNGTWTIGCALDILLSASWTGEAALFVMEPDGATIRGTLFATSAFGAGRTTVGAEVTVLGSPTASTVTAQDGDYLLLELGYAATAGSASDNLYTSGTTAITTDNVATSSAQSFLQYSGTIAFYNTASTLYLRLGLSASSGITLPGAWKGGFAATSTALGKALNLTAGSSQLSVSATGGNPDTGLGQFCSPSLSAQVIASGTWTIGCAFSHATAGFASGEVYIALMNGSTGAVRTVIYATALFGGNDQRSSETTAYGTASGGSATSSLGDYILVEVGINNSTGFTPVLYADGGTVITSDNVATSDAQSAIAFTHTLAFKPASPLAFTVTDTLTVTTTLARNGLPSSTDIIAAITAITAKGSVSATASLALGGAVNSNASTVTTSLLKALESTIRSGNPVPISPITVKDVQAITGSRTLTTTLIVVASSLLSQSQALTALLKATDAETTMADPTPTDVVKAKDIPVTTLNQALATILGIITSAVPSGKPLVSDSTALSTILRMLAGPASLTTITVKDALTRQGTLSLTDADIIHDALSDLGKATVTDSPVLYGAPSDLGTPAVVNALKVSDLGTYFIAWVFTATDRMTLAESTTARGTYTITDIETLITALSISGDGSISASPTPKDTTALVATHALIEHPPVIDKPKTTGLAAATTTTRILDTPIDIGTPTAADNPRITTSELAKGTIALSTNFPIRDTPITTGTHALTDTDKPADTAKSAGSGDPIDAIIAHDTVIHTGTASVTDRMVERETLTFFAVLFFAVADRLLAGGSVSVVGARTVSNALLASDTPITRVTFSTADHATIVDLARSFGAAYPIDTLRIAEQLAQVITMAVRDATGIHDRAIPTFNVIITNSITIRESSTFILRLKSGRVLGTLTINPASGTVTMNGVAGQVALTPIVGTITID